MGVLGGVGKPETHGFLGLGACGWTVIDRMFGEGLR
jgi:hypothetical protein